MDKNWVKIYESQDQIRIETLKIGLEDRDIPAIVLNKKDTVYNMFGEVELWVNKLNAVEALNIIQEFTA